jgi:leucyl aminopeptidase
MNSHISRLFRRGDISGTCGETFLLPEPGNIAAQRALLIGCGREEDFDNRKLHKVTASLIQKLQNSNINEAMLFLSEIEVEGTELASRIEHITAEACYRNYHFDTTKSKKQKNSKRIQKLTIFISDRENLGRARDAVFAGLAVSSGVNFARELGNLPGNICTPEYLANQAKDLAADFNMKFKVLTEKAMEKLSMGALLSVSRGSRQEAKLIILEHKGGNSKDAPIVLVGKGLTFDAGGISLKPSSAMDEMKFDMCGGASVLGTMRAIAELKLPLNVIAIVPSSENMPDGDANKPGDVVTSMSGQTIEILNTDAEGRLILCDALTYAERYNPSTVIDVATLTGAVVAALGSHASGVFSNQGDLAQEIIDAGISSMDRVWYMPLWEEYDQQLKSNFADMANIGGPKAGAITAACFLARYTKKYDWAHLDIAGTAWHSGSKKGSTGRPVKLLIEFLRKRAQKS